MAEHTPLPWSTDPDVGHEAILGPDGLMVADCAIFDRRIELSRLPANAAFIVKACNNHEALLEALRDWVTVWDQPVIDGSAHQKALRNARDILFNIAGRAALQEAGQ